MGPRKDPVDESMNRPKLPEFRSEEDERTFWAEHDSTEFVDWQSAKKRRLPNLKPSPPPARPPR